jgi:hypothetical protein
MASDSASNGTVAPWCSSSKSTNAMQRLDHALSGLTSGQIWGDELPLVRTCWVVVMSHCARQPGTMSLPTSKIAEICCCK